MTELIKVTEENGNKLVSARELHEFLESKQDFTTWIKGRIDKYGFIENEDFTLHKFMVGKSVAHNYILKMDMAKELSMVENNDKGRQARKYFIECEKKLNTLKLPTTYKEALLELVRVEEEREKLQIENSKLVDENKTQHKLIDTMTESYDGTYIRMVSHDYINKACKQTNQSQSELYNKVYKLVGRSLKIDLDVQLKNSSNKERQIVKSNMEYNRENNLKGMDRKTPCFIKDSKAEISKLEFICNVLGRGIVVLESIAKVCEVGISEVVSKYNIIKETAKIKGDDYNV